MRIKMLLWYVISISSDEVHKVHFFFPKIFVSNYSQIFLRLILYNYCNCICIKLYANLIIRSHQVKVEIEITYQIYN